MTKILLITEAALLVALVIVFFLWRKSSERNRNLLARLEGANKALAEAIAEQARLESTIQILKKNREEADEKINNLHSGNATANALDELHKRRN